MKRRGNIRLVTMVVAVMCAAPLLVADRAERAEAKPQRGPISSDFNGDGWSDLAISSEQNEMEDFEFSHGVVQIVYGSPPGLGVRKTQSWSDSDFLPAEDRSAA